MKRSGTFFVIFTISGFSGLIYESIWTHYLKLFLGHAAYAQTLVLAIFMGGMAIGSALCSKYSWRWRNVLAGYAIAEGCIGVGALVFHTVFNGSVNFAFTTIIPALASPGTINAFKWTMSAVLILPQSVLLGMTFPLMSAAFVRMFPDRAGSSIAMLYFTNSIGAAIGVLVSGFFLIRNVGLPGTIRLAGLINVILAVIVWRLSRNLLQSEERLTGSSQPGSLATRPVWHLLLLVSLITGTASFIYEIGWIRMLSLVLGSSTHAFELMLSAFILGLAFGGLWIKRRIDTIDVPVRFLAVVQMVMGLLALATLPLYGNTFNAMQWLIGHLGKTPAGYFLFNLASHSIACVIMLPATFCAGMTLPLITTILLREGSGEKSIGAVYAANTVGAIIGVFFAIHVGLPQLGLKGLLILGAGLDIALGLFLAWQSASGYVGWMKPGWMTGGCVAAIAGTVFIVQLDPYKMASGVYRKGILMASDTGALLYHKDGKTATVSITQEAGFMSIRTNGKSDSAISFLPDGKPAPDESTMVLAGAIPLVFHPDARLAANIGFGTGLTSQNLLCSPRLQEVDTIEIEPMIVEAARLFGDRVGLVYRDPRSRICIDDAKTFFSSHSKRYDIIVSEPSNPWVSGVAGLFSDEFYQMVNRHLRDDGIFVQWLQLYEIDLDLVASVLKAITANFSDYSIYAANNYDLLIVAKKHSSLGQPNPVLWESPVLRKSLERVGINSIDDLNIRRVGTKRFIDPFLTTFPIRANSDYHPVLDQNAARSRFMDSYALDLIELNLESLPIIQ
ncbi:MAG TPA: hypothetical protein VK187_02015, partial [Geobacteraceae bacterium]|nr:hypothetical protein [Geobacteraceae bacterium]